MAKIHDVKLTQISSVHNNVRTREIVGVTGKLPKLGEIFRMTAPPLERNDGFRMLTTTVLKDVKKKGNKYIFETQNSKYELEVLDES